MFTPETITQRRMIWDIPTEDDKFTAIGNISNSEVLVFGTF